MHWAEALSAPSLQVPTFGNRSPERLHIARASAGQHSTALQQLSQSIRNDRALVAITVISFITVVVAVHIVIGFVVTERLAAVETSDFIF